MIDRQEIESIKKDLQYLIPQQKEQILVNSFKEFHNILYPDWQLFDKQLELVEFANTIKGVKFISATRDIGKTMLLTIVLTLYKSYKDPLFTSLLIGSSYNIAKEWIIVCGELIKSNPDLFPKWRVTKTTIRSKANLHNPNPTIAIGTLSTTLRGKHPNRIVLDDLLTLENETRNLKQKAKRKYDECLSLLSSAKGIMPDLLVIGNPVSNDDLYSELNSNVFISKKAIWNADLPEEQQKDIEVLRKNGVAEHNIQANYFGRIIGRVSGFSDLKTTSPALFKFITPTIGVIDPSFEGEDLIGITFMDDKANTLCLSLEGNIHHEGIKTQIKNICEQSKCKELYIECNNEIGAFLSLEKYLDCRVLPFKSTANKEKRIESYITMLKPYLNICSNSDFKEHVSSFYWGNKDDVIDSLATACNLYINYSQFKTKSLKLLDKIKEVNI